MTIQESQDEIVEEFGSIDDWMEKYSLLIDIGNEMEPYPEEHRTEEFLIDGCQSKVWIYPHLEADGSLTLMGDSDAIIVKGLVGLLLRVASGRQPSELAQADLNFISRIGLGEHMTPTRQNGLLAMTKQIRLYALAYEAKAQL